MPDKWNRPIKLYDHTVFTMKQTHAQFPLKHIYLEYAYS